MRRFVWLLVLVPSVAAADEDNGKPGIRVRRLDAPPTDEPLLHLDPNLFDTASAEGGVVAGQSAVIDLGPRARFAAQGTWWQTGLSPSMFAEDLTLHGWQAAGELSYDLGWFRIGINASLGRYGDLSHRMVGLFAYKTFRLSRWMNAWIALGLGWEQWSTPALAAPRQGTTVGLSIGTTFR